MSSASRLTVVRFEPAHFDRLELQPSQEYVRAHTPRSHLEELASQGPAVSFFAGDRLICCGGLREYGPDRGVVWSYIDRRAGRHFVALHRCALRFLETVERSHMQATCRTGFEAGAHWLRMLGFTWSRSLGPYGPGRVPHELFERVRA